MSERSGLAGGQLTQYLRDHLTGAETATKIIEDFSGEDGYPAFREIAESVLPEIRDEKALLKRLADDLDGRRSVLRSATAWVTAQGSQLKLGKTFAGELGPFEALEFLSLGILGKRGLWRVLKELGPNDGAFAEADFDQLIKNAERQYEQVERHRLEAARSAFVVE